MYLTEVLKTGKPFKRKKKTFYLSVNQEGKIGFEESGGFIEATLTKEDILADDWMIKEEWYEGDFKKKYPKGLICWAWDYDGDDKAKVVMIAFNKKSEFPFETEEGCYRYAEPITKEEAPTILDRGNDVYLSK